jgi:hypothetical protein
MTVKAITGRPLEILQTGQVIWRGSITEKLQEIVVPVAVMAPPGIELELRTATAATPEGPGATGRALGFALYSVRID